ncbi:ATP-binding protein, partial [Streptomyces sp. NPDC059816]|uniref:ATP-binding protein n=1 Tax=Streptomyces sp. NPDC059816 TaxID=3346960 RepID=UPI003665A6C2
MRTTRTYDTVATPRPPHPRAHALPAPGAPEAGPTRPTAAAGKPVPTQFIHRVQQAARSVTPHAPPGLQPAVFRLVQEALTNTMKHSGPGAAAEVQVRYETGLVSITVTDTGGTPGSGPSPRTEPSASVLSSPQRGQQKRSGSQTLRSG